MSPASVLAHGGGDSDAFCHDERHWIDRDSDATGVTGYERVHVGHGGGGGGCMGESRKANVVCMARCMYTGLRSWSINKHGLL